MGLLIGDDRECARVVTDLLLDRNKPKRDKLVDRQVGETRVAFLFGHYDSRGGGALVLADNHIEALKKYMQAFFDFDADLPDGGQDFDKDAYDGMIDNAQGDFIRRVQLVVCDEALPDEDGVDLDVRFNDDGYLYGNVQSRYVPYQQTEPTDWSDHTSRSIFVLWKAPKNEAGQTDWEAIDEEGWRDTVPQLLIKSGRLNEEYRLERDDLAEDAFGLCLIK